MDIQWLGHSAFKLVESTGTTIVTDPYSEDAVGYAMDTVSADVVTVSHGHEDHNAVALVQGDPVVLNTEGNFEMDGVHIISISSKHGTSDYDRGDNLIFKFRMDGVDICHLGDIGDECSVELSEYIGSVDILLVPVGGNFTIDAEQAKEYVELLMPDVVIPMHFKTRDCEIDIDKVDAFLRLFDEEQIMYVNGSVHFDRTEFEGESTKVLIFNR